MRRCGLDHAQLRNRGPEPVCRRCLKRCHVRDVLPKPRLRDTRGFSEGGDLRHGLGSGAASVLLRAAHDIRAQAQTLPDVQRADPLGRVNLVAADAYQIGAEAFRREVKLHEGLHRVRMQKRRGAFLFQNTGNGGNIRHSTGFVVDQHKRNEYSIRAKSRAYVLGRDRAGVIGLEVCHLITAPFKLLGGFAHCVMLDQGSDDVLSLAAHGLRAGEQGPVVALRAAGGKRQLRRVAAQRPGDKLPRAIEQLFRLPAFGVSGAGVAVVFQHGVQSRLRSLRAHAGGRGVIKIVFHLCKPHYVE